MTDYVHDWERGKAMLMAMLAALALCAPTAILAQATGRDAQQGSQARDSVPAQNPEPGSQADTRDPGRNVWSTPLSGIAGALGLSGLFSKFGANDSVAAALGGVLLVLPLIVAAFFAWQFVRRRRVLDPDHKAAAVGARHGAE